MARITVDGIAHAYGGKPRSEEDYALKPLHHVWEQGMAYALLGPSGCGKTTLLNIISGLVIPSEGRGRESAGAVEHKDAVRVDPRFDLRARLPLMHPGRETHPNADADIDVNEAFRPAKLGHLHFAGKAEARRLSVADGHCVGPKAESINAVRQSREGADERQIATACQCDERAALLNDELVQGGSEKTRAASIFSGLR
jgi:energy-coupling factor transporter ATP-binding protein EcfA2